MNEAIEDWVRWHHRIVRADNLIIEMTLIIPQAAPCEMLRTKLLTRNVEIRTSRELNVLK